MVLVDKKGRTYAGMGVPGKTLSFTPQHWLQVNLPPNLKSCAAALGSTFPPIPKNQPVA
jgi:hypothetical protein